ncbi:mannitol 1-phosphate dehydrogenase [Melanomma pulvis-pyrius CBS 109.77]|uniref:Mannitol 1-phosphate dehydrogenase n=1 Tax=Melanomma pulvis-pyrius CBS 109.77 TaxID=1314802 RepID=A0A6A6XSG4_9PLEO|nr:mannitol 1-phosphate dehydrogenase [Melanomma pulvis-pyrius CBS 109.77]
MAAADASTKPFNIAIVGGGISGLTLAIALLQHDIPVTIYEGARHFGEIGAGVGFGPNAARAMALMSPKIRDAFVKCKTHNLWDSNKQTFFTCRVGDARKADKEGFVRPGKKVGDALFDVRFTNQENSGGVYRAHFLDELVKSVPDNVAKFGKKLVNIDDAEDGSGDAVLKFGDGTSAQHTAVIGCDGIKSRTREFVLGKEDPATRAVFSGKYAYRGLIPMDKAINMLGEEVAQNSQMFFGYHGHLLTFPIEKGKTMNVVAFNSRDTWDDENWVVTTSKEDMEADYSSWGSTVKTIVSAMQKPDIWALFMHPPASTFFKGRVCLLGDAAHATTPHHGAGAGMCIEDGLILSTLMKEAKSAEDLERVFKVYDEVRRPRGLKNVVTSKEAGMLYDFELEGDDLDKIEEDFTKRVKWIWDVDLQVEMDRARKIYSHKD